MKNIFLFFLFIICTSLLPPHGSKHSSSPVTTITASENVFVIIIDGFRWQEVFGGADSVFVNDEAFTPDTATVKSLYWADTREERRKRLLPFFWNVIAKKGQLFGNRSLGSTVDVANPYSISYPGYNEIFTGTTDILISGNGKKYNRHTNVLEYLAAKEEFKNRVAVFSSWDVFPYILNQKRNGIAMNSGYQELQQDEQNIAATQLINNIQEKGIEVKTECRYDQLTFTVAKEYIQNHSPRIVVIGLGETDQFAHQQRYDLYLQQANQFDRMLAELWLLVQSSPKYKDKTSFLITTDHGRGKRQWSKHGFFVKGSSQTWLALLGPGIINNGEITNSPPLYNKQFAQTIANLAGEDFHNSPATLAQSKMK